MIRFISFFVFLLVLSSCKKEEVIEEPWECLPCSHYYGSMSGSLQVQSTGLDTSFINAPTIIEITEGVNDSVNVAIDLSSLLNQIPGTVVIDFNQAYWVDSLIIDDEIEYSGVTSMSSQLNATCSYQYQVLVGSITLSGTAANGAITFETIR